ncbi:MAG: penicillin-binding protein 2, partial [Armatimonadetes bacterium]|nr:penicillin-binding protein 2 [Armatimonadota bacterium]
LEDPTRPKFTPVVVREDLDPVLLTRVEERLWRLPSVVIEKVPLRWYPRAAVTAHVVGYVGIISPDELDERRSKQDQEIAALKARIQQARHEFSDEQMPELEQLLDRLAILQRLRSHAETMVGKTGLEAQYEDYLQGEPAIRTWQVNARNEPVKLLATRAGAPGNSVYLNLDAAMQDLAARLLRGRRGSAVAIDPRDGAVLTIYGSPSYDPNLFIPRIRSRDWARILNDPARPLQNRAIRNIYPPGSTFKLVTSAAGLEAGSITPRTTVSCPGGLQVGSMFKRCWSTHGGGIDLTRALAVSCDTYYYRAALKMGPHPVLDTATMFGLGAPTGIDLPNEHPGRLPTDEWHRRHHERDWYPGDTANIAIGQGDIAATSLQMALVAATVANGGTIYQPQVVREIRSRDGRVVRRWQPKRLRRIPLPPDSIERIRHGLRAAVTNGTAGAAALPNIAVAGKTGSAEDPPRNLPHAWFVCFAPYDRPQIAVAVMVENAGHGGENSAPVAKALMEQYFRSRGITP